jgi:hypothetical protein
MIKGEVGDKHLLITNLFTWSKIGCYPVPLKLKGFGT